MVDEIDPINPSWWQFKGKWSRLTRMSRGPLGNGNVQTLSHPLGELAELRPNGSLPDVNWQAYTLSISQPGRPHVVEIDYPSDVPQTLGLSILEPNAAGAWRRWHWNRAST